MFYRPQQQQQLPTRAFQSLDRISGTGKGQSSRRKWAWAGFSLLLLITLYLCGFTGDRDPFAALSSPEGTVPFWTFTDVHLAADYVAGSDPQTFCTAGEGDAGRVGTFNCDVPRERDGKDAAPILDSALSYTVKAPLPPEAAPNRNAGFALFLGDSSTLYKEHPLGTETEEQIESNMAALATKLEQRFGARVFPTLGNHDRHPNTGCPLPSDPAYDRYLRTVARLWSRWLGPRALDSVRKGGYYYADVYAGIRLISLNTMFFWTENNNKTEDIAGQLAWLDSTLYAMDPSRKAIIFGHVPPFANLRTMRPMWTPYALERYRGILDRHGARIAAQIFGHMHADAFMDVGDGTYAMIAPGLTPRLSTKPPLSGDTNGKHPAFRAYLVNPRTGKIADYVQYWANLTMGNKRGRLTWEKSYSFLDEYGLSPKDGVSSESFRSIAERMSSSDETWCKLFRHAFAERYFAQGNNEKSRRVFVCSVRHSTDPSKLVACMKTLSFPRNGSTNSTCQQWEI